MTTQRLSPTANSRIVYRNDRFDLVEFESAASEKKHYCVRKPDAVVVVPRHQGKVLLIEVVRSHIGLQGLEFAGGRIEPGEAPAEAALRELREETGLAAQGLTELGITMPLPSLTTERVTGFVADVDAKSLHELVLDADEGIVASHWVAISDLLQLCQEGQIGCSVDAFFALLVFSLARETA